VTGDCVEVEDDSAGLRPVGREQSWQAVLDAASAVRLIRDTDRAGLSLYEIDHVDDGRTRRYLVAEGR
jgi:hypothetical protein